MEAISAPRPLSETDDVTSFDCGRPSLDEWLRVTGFKNQTSGVSRTNVITETATGRIIGFVTLSAGQIERAFLSKSRQRNKPDPVPILLLGKLAIHKDHQGKGYAAHLLRFALETCIRVSDAIGSFGVVTHPIDDGVRGFYRKWGFEDLPGDPRRAMIVRMIDLKASFADLTKRDLDPTP